MAGYIGTQPVPQATQTRDTFTATASQTSFATSGYTPSFLDVFLNGVHLQNGTDYTASNGSDVVLTAGAAAGDILEVVAYTTFETFGGTVTADSLSVDGGTIKLDGNYPVGLYNVALGDNSGAAITTGGDNNVFIGADAAPLNTTGSRQVLVGRGAGFVNTTGNDNSGIGWAALGGNTTGASNTAIGSSALYSNTTASNNTAVGYQAGYNNTTGTEMTAVGKGAMQYNTTGNYNTAVGYQTLRFNTTGSDNTAYGDEALRSNTSGGKNTVSGNIALYANTTGSNNVAFGMQALRFNTTASNNTAVGYQAGYSKTTAPESTMVGYQAGYNETTGGYNAFFGTKAGYAVTTGQENTFVGRFSGSAITTGGRNSILGKFSGNQGGLDIRTSSNNIVLSDGDGNPRASWNSSGAMTTSTTATGTYALTVNSTSSTGYPLLLQYTTASPNDTTYRFLTCRDPSTPSMGRMYVYSNGNVVNTNNSYGSLSDQKLKENIVDASSQWDDIKALTVRKYSMKADNLDAPNMLGVIAQEVEAAGMNGLVFESPDKDADNNDLGTVTKQVNYSILYMKAVKALQEAMDRIETLEAKVTALENA